MATPSAKRFLKVRGRLCTGPTDLSTDFPHGGTALGTVRGVVFRPAYRHHKILATEFGVTTEIIRGGEDAVLACVFREWDPDALAAIFLDTTDGATTGRKLVRSRVKTDGVRAGAKLSDKAAKLYFSPDAKQDPGVLMYEAVPMIEESAEVRLSIDAEAGFPAAWHAIPNDSNKAFELGLREDLTL